jgi:hypothetical protein
MSKISSSIPMTGIFLPSLNLVTNRKRDPKTVKKRIKQIMKSFIIEKCDYDSQNDNQSLPFLHVFVDTSNRIHLECYSKFNEKQEKITSNYNEEGTCLDFIFTRKDIESLEEKIFNPQRLPLLLEKSKKISTYKELETILSDTVCNFYQQWIPRILNEKELINIFRVDSPINNCYYYLFLCLEEMMDKTINLLDNHEQSVKTKEVENAMLK